MEGGQGRRLIWMGKGKSGFAIVKSPMLFDLEERNRGCGKKGISIARDYYRYLFA